MRGHLVAEIISLNGKLQIAKEKKNEQVRQRKLQAIRRVFQCTHCSIKCEKCGTSIDSDRSGVEKDAEGIRIPYRFCTSCAEEYTAYVDRLKGQEDPDCYWHNEEWLDIWQKWIDYQGSIDRYTKSKAFLRLLKEMRQTPPDE
ncbi:MAG: hypothetical protein C4530_12855 [Desulfobacteraceae bacterium]|nr:MAG: hypothetical protein C4530_12855 [Desulfobacteraceae bacterium]